MKPKSLCHKPDFNDINIGGVKVPDNNDKEFSFRNEITVDDPVKILEIIESSRVFSPEEKNVAIELANERLKKGAQSGYHFLFGERYGKMIGYACFGRIAGTISSFDIYWLAVHRDLHNLGIGKAILTKSESIISGMGGDRVYIETSSRKSYDPARLFYSRCGYKREAILKDFYSTGDNKVIYVKEINKHISDYRKSMPASG